MLKVCIVICGKAFMVVKMSLAFSVKLQFDLHSCPVVISATSTLNKSKNLSCWNFASAKCFIVSVLQYCLLHELWKYFWWTCWLLTLGCDRNRSFSHFWGLYLVQSRMFHGVVFLILTLVHFVSIETCRGKYGNERKCCLCVNCCLKQLYLRDPFIVRWIKK